MCKKIIKRSSRYYLEVIILCMLCIALLSATSFASTPSGEIDIYPTKIPISHDALIIHYKINGLTASTDHYIKGRIKQGSSYFGSIWNGSTNSWKKQTDSWSTMPIVSSGSSGDLQGYLYLKSSASLMGSATVDLEITMRAVGSTTNVGPFAATNLGTFKESASDDGIHVSGMAYSSNFDPAENKLVIGRDHSGLTVCTYTTENNGVTESSFDAPGNFSLSCPNDTKNISIYDLQQNTTALGTAELPNSIPGGANIDIFINDVSNGGLDTSGPILSDINLSSIRITTGDSLSVSLTASDALNGGSPISSAQFAVMGSGEAIIASPDWIDMAPSDGSFDSPTESVNTEIAVANLNSGQHHILFRALDSSGNSSVTLERRFMVFNAKFSDEISGNKFYFSTGDGACVFVDINDIPVFSGYCDAKNNHRGYFTLMERSGRSLLLGSLSLSRQKAYLMAIKAQKTHEIYFLRDS